MSQESEIIEAEEVNTEAAPSENQTITLNEASVEQIKAAAFDVEQNIKALQSQYQTLIAELQRRSKSE